MPFVYSENRSYENWMLIESRIYTDPLHERNAKP